MAYYMKKMTITKEERGAEGRQTKCDQAGRQTDKNSSVGYLFRIRYSGIWHLVTITLF